MSSAAMMMMMTTTIMAVAVLLQTACSGFPTNTFTLERASHAVTLSQMKANDGLRQQSTVPVFGFNVQGNNDPYHVGLYFTKVLLGSPPKEYHVQIDTGSNEAWVGCHSCHDCPNTTELVVPPVDLELHPYDPSRSSTSSLIECSDRRCSLGNSTCYASNKRCSYTFEHHDGSTTSGYYVSDQMHLDAVSLNSTSSNASASIMFGCSMNQTGYLTSSARAVDGIFGFGPQGSSIISQLASQGVIWNEFAHCLVGGWSWTGSGGLLVLAHLDDPDLVYTPLIPSQPQYNVNLLSISVNGKRLPIDPSVFAKTGSRGGTVVDSGTTLAYITEEAFEPLLDTINRSVSPFVKPVIHQGERCYMVPVERTIDIFPPVNLTFDGGASLVLTPQDYLIPELGDAVTLSSMYCLGLLELRGQGLTILGALVLKDKVVVYDLDGQRIGWHNYDCTEFSVIANSCRRKTINEGQIWNMLLLIFFVFFWL